MYINTEDDWDFEFSPHRGYKTGYSFELVAYNDWGEEDEEDEEYVVRKAKFQWVKPKDFAEIQEEFQRSKAAYTMIISCLKRLERFGKFRIDFQGYWRFDLLVIPNGDVEEVSEYQERFHRIAELAKMGTRQTMSENEYQMSSDIESSIITIKLDDTISRSRFGTVVKNITYRFRSYSLEVLGEKDEDWFPFKKNVEYDGFLVRRKTKK